MAAPSRPDQSGRRRFIGKLSTLGALSVASPWKQVVNPPLTETPGTESRATDYVLKGNLWPQLAYHKGANLSREDGPNLTNLFCRLEVPISGNLKHFQIIGNQGETQFIQAIQSTESSIFYKNQFYVLAESDEIRYDYALSSISISYKNKALPFLITKTIYLPDNYSCCIQHITLKNTSTQSVECYFVEQVNFTLGDPYYTMPASKGPEQIIGFRISNELNRNYTGTFVMSGNDVLKVWCRNDQIQYQMRIQKAPWLADQYILRNCDDQSALLQKKLIIAGNTESDFVIYVGASAASNEPRQGIGDLTAIYQSDQFSQLEKELTKKADAFAMIRTPDYLFNQGFAISNKVAGQVFQSSEGLVALPGHMYANFYSRDSHWQIHGLLANGQFDVVKKLLSHFTNYQNAEGSFPTRINLAGKPIYHTSAPDLDSAALIWLSVIEYIRWSKDYTFGEQNWKNITASIQFLQSKDTDQDGWLEQDYDQDWADRTKRHGKVNYTQSVYFQLLKEASELGDVLNKPEALVYKNRANTLRENYDATFWDEASGFYLDYIAPDGTRMNKLSQDVCLAFAFGLTSDSGKIKRHLAKLKQTCWRKWGPAHHEGYRNGSKYDPVGFYCNGGVWMWLTAFEAYAHFRFGQPEDGIFLLNTIKEYEFGKNPYNAIYFDTIEWHDSLNGLNCEHDWKQCRNFTTGSGAHVWAVLGGLLGLRISIKGEVDWKPRFPNVWKGQTVSLHSTRTIGINLNKSFTVT